ARVPAASPDTDSAFGAQFASSSRVTSIEAVNDLPEPLGPAKASHPSANSSVSSAHAHELTAPARVGCHRPTAAGTPRTAGSGGPADVVMPGLCLSCWGRTVT